MAAYAAAVSLMHILDLLNNHPSPPISLDKQLHSLTETVPLLQEFLEGYVSPFSYSDEADPLEIRIAEAVYAAEDVIESYIVDSIHLAAAATTLTKHGDDEVDSIQLAAAATTSTSTSTSTKHDDDDVDSIQLATEAAQEKYSPCLMRECFTFMQEFLEGHISSFINIYKADPLEIRIAESTAETEHDDDDVVSIHLAAVAAKTTEHDDDDVDSIHLAATAAQDEDEQIRYINFYQGLQKVIEAMDLIKKEAMDMEMEKKARVEVEVQGNVSAEGGFKYSSTESKIEMVGFDDVQLQLKERLVGGDSNRQIIPIVGMGGIGKTTLARNVFVGKLIQEHFDICLWATISQDHNIEQTLSEVISQVKVNLSDEIEAGLGEELYKCLFGRRYLVVLDDMWSIEVWDNMRFFFPENNNRSRIIVTTRLSNLAAHLTNSSNILCMSFLNEVDSWTLFSKTVLGSGGSVLPGLREIGKKIVGKCKGLPLSITVIGGLLAKSELTQGYWEHVEKNLSSIVNLENEEYCLRVLKLSYNHLPVYLKPCFLYMGVFDEDSEIKVSTIINLWVSEGFVKPRKTNNLERVAREYLQELVDRNLILSYELESGWPLMGGGELGSVVMCKMHDLVRDLSLREAQKQRFYSVHRQSKEDGPSTCNRRIVIPKNSGGIHVPQIMLESSSSSSNSRSYVSHDDNAPLFQDSRLLRTLHAHTGWIYSQKDVFGLVNLRLLATAVGGDRWLDSSISRLWSLHTLIVYSLHELEGPVEFWNMHQLKQVEFTVGRLRLQLPPPKSDDSIVIMENMHWLFRVVDFHLNEDVVTRMPNLRILVVDYQKLMNREAHCLSYLQRLSKLESFRCCSVSGENLRRICFPQSLKQILLLVDDYDSPHFELEDILQKIGELPFVEELGIQGGFFGRGEWETIEGQFPKLKTLELCLHNLRKWTVPEASHFPLLQKLILRWLSKLEEIPSEIGEIATLKSIELRYCSRSAVLSAKRIVEEQEDSYGEDQLSFRVRARVAIEHSRAWQVPTF